MAVLSNAEHDKVQQYWSYQREQHRVAHHLEPSGNVWSFSPDNHRPGHISGSVWNGKYLVQCNRKKTWNSKNNVLEWRISMSLKLKINCVPLKYRSSSIFETLETLETFKIVLIMLVFYCFVKLSNSFSNVQCMYGTAFSYILDWFFLRYSSYWKTASFTHWLCLFHAFHPSLNFKLSAEWILQIFFL